MKTGKIIVYTLVALLILFALRVVTAPGVQSFIKGNIPREKHLTNVIIWKGIPGPEDMEVSYGQGLIFISSVERRGDSPKTGALYYIDLRLPLAQQAPVRLDIDYPRMFHPHGMSLREMGDQLEIYVISHREDGRERIEIFQARRIKDRVEVFYKDGITFKGPYNPNDLRVLPDGRFLLSHDSKKGRNEYFDIMINARKAPLSYFDGLHFIHLRHRTVMGNGIVSTTEGSRTIIYRADTIQKFVDKLELYSDVSGPALRFIKRIKLPSSPDNLSLDPQGNIYVACHYSFGKFIRHIKDPAQDAPSQVFKIDTNDKVSLVYADDGSEYDAASVAVPVGKYLYLGQIFDDRILVGEMRD